MRLSSLLDAPKKRAGLPESPFHRHSSVVWLSIYMLPSMMTLDHGSVEWILLPSLFL